MRHQFSRSSGVVLRSSRRRFPILPFLGVAGLALGVGVWSQATPPAPLATTVVGEAAPKASPTVPAQTATPRSAAHRADPAFDLALAPQPLGASAPLTAEFQWTAPREVAALEPEPAPIVVVEAAREAPPPPAVLAPVAPLPPQRPAELRLPPQPERPRVATAPATRRAASALAQAEPSDDRTFFEKLFGTKNGSGQAMAYAAPQDELLGRSPAQRLSPAVSRTTPGTAVYDIAAKTVYLPNGEKLEAHSGLGERMDDVRHVSVRMKGPTPPHVYDLKEREALFHGVRAIRLTPVGGAGAIYGRDGLLAHTYLLGPRGDSNGCVSIRDYDRFLQAYLRGEIRRLVVVASL